MKIEAIDEAQAQTWQDYVMESPDSTFYHQYQWRRALEKGYNLQTWYLMATEGGRTCGILPLAEISSLLGNRSMISLPFSNYGGVVADSAEAESALLDEARKILIQRNMKYMELKHVRRCEEAGLIDKLDYHSLELTLKPNPEEVWKSDLNSKVRNQVRKAEKTGVTAAVGSEQFPAYFSIYRQNLRDLGTPTHSMRWFQATCDLFPEETTAIVCSVEGEPVAGAQLLFFKDIAILHSAASLMAYRKYCPNNLVYWKAIELCCKRGCRVLDFARSRVGAGTYHFKQQWGAVPKQTFYQYILNTAKEPPDVDPTNPKFKLAIAGWQRLPLPIANTIGPILRRRITT
jgi:FemAB-related protein (PEP-CTERM system-associated)